MDRCIQQLLAEQDGVIARRQIVAQGYDDNWIENRLRRREWARVHRGVYVCHTGPLTWMQQAWAALLFYWPAALCARSALEVARSGASLRRQAADSAPVEVAVDRDRRVRRIRGVRITRVTGLTAQVQPSRMPPRVRIEHAVVHAASAARSEAEALGLLADACQQGRTTAARLVSMLMAECRLTRRRFLLEVMEDVATGAYSVLEHRYLTRVERPHGLPTARRQRVTRRAGHAAYRDVEYLGTGVVVELDGRLGHEMTLDRWHDAERDIASALAGVLTVRLTWGQVLDPCRSAVVVWRLLRARGWSADLGSCGPTCSAGRWRDSGAFPAARADNAPLSA